MIPCIISSREEDVDADAGVEQQEAEEGEEVADEMATSAPTTIATRMAIALIRVANARLHLKATRTMQPSRT